MRGDLIRVIIWFVLKGNANLPSSSMCVAIYKIRMDIATSHKFS
jgi:hypothetical protein